MINCIFFLNPFIFNFSDIYYIDCFDDQSDVDKRQYESHIIYCDFNYSVTTLLNMIKKVIFFFE